MKTKLKKLFPGFSLVEVLAAVAIIGVVTFMAIPNIVRLKVDGEENLVRARAETLNMAMASYVQALGITAATAGTNWPTAIGAAGDESRYLRIRSYIAFPPLTLSNGFIPGGYRATLPPSLANLASNTVIFRPNGTQIFY